MRAIVTVDDCRRTVEEQKIIEKESLDDIGEWNIEINAKLAEADNEVKRMKEWLESRQHDQETREHKEQIKHETRMKFQTELQMAKSKQNWQEPQDPNHPEIEWRYVPTHDNPADLASRGGTVTTPLWWTGPECYKTTTVGQPTQLQKLQQIQRLRPKSLKRSLVCRTSRRDEDGQLQRPSRKTRPTMRPPNKIAGSASFQEQQPSQHPLLVNFQKTEPPEKQPSKSCELILQGQYGIEELRSERERPIGSFSLAVCRERST
ncbi:Hypothetical predicted protein [Paramuricea clavata]|uniref:Uncharacterized protein n=1 Tax=Paramuricea clavata TaxID=317549 RepID=A0A6S7LCN9_PARCT|nr:Hypothetical predicted protein [Paramuricea clavata]